MVLSSIQNSYNSVSAWGEKAKNSFCNALDIPKFPVEGSVFGYKHWERFDVYKQDPRFKEQLYRISKAEGNLFRGTSWRKVTKDLKGLGVKLRSPIEGGSKEGKNVRYYRLVISSDENFKDVISGIENLNSITKIQPIQEEELLWNFEHFSLHDKSTNLVFEGFGNTQITLRGKGFAIAIATPFYALGTLCYNLIRIIGVIFYLSIRIFYDYAKAAKESRSLKVIVKDRFKVMGWQTWISVRNIIRTVFFAPGFFLGAIYMIIDPYNGMKITGCFEYHWNHRLPIERSWWFVPQRDFHLEGGGKIENLGNSTFALAGCLIPRAQTVSDGDGYKLAYLSKEDEDPVVKTNRKITNIHKDFLLFSFPFCLPISFPAKEDF